MALIYPDVSNNNGPINLAGAAAVCAKATEGSTFKDGLYEGFKAQAAAMGAPFAAYHWINTADIHAQAVNAFSKVGPGVPIMWDAEALGVTVSRLLDLTAQYRALGGLAVMVYLPAWWWHDHMGAPDLRPLADAGLALVSSNYPSDGTPASGAGWHPYGGVTPSIWQYTSKATINGAHGVDMNAYQGTVDQLRALWGLATPPHLEDDMTPEQAQQLDDTYWREDAAASGSKTIRGGAYKGEWYMVNVMLQTIQDQLAAIHAGGGPGGLTEAQVAAAVRAELDKTHLAS